MASVLFLFCGSITLYLEVWKLFLHSNLSPVVLFPFPSSSVSPYCSGFLISQYQCFSVTNMWKLAKNTGVTNMALRIKCQWMQMNAWSQGEFCSNDQRVDKCNGNLTHIPCISGAHCGMLNPSHIDVCWFLFGSGWSWGWCGDDSHSSFSLHWFFSHCCSKESFKSFAAGILLFPISLHKFPKHSLPQNATKDKELHVPSISFPLGARS